MDKAPIKDKDIGILHNNYGPDDKFREVRAKAKQEEDQRIRKTKKNKHPNEFPKYKIGESVVLYSTAYRKNHRDRDYHLVEVLDIEKSIYRDDSFTYYAILRKTTSEEMAARIGHLVHFPGDFWRGLSPANVGDTGIKWKF